MRKRVNYHRERCPMNDSVLLVDKRDGIATLTLNRPEK